MLWGSRTGDGDPTQIQHLTPHLPAGPKFLTAEQKYDLWVRILTGQITQAEAAAEVGVYRSMIARLRAVARDAAVAALASSRPRRSGQSRAEATEASTLRSEVERLGRTVVEQALELAVLQGNTGYR